MKGVKSVARRGRGRMLRESFFTSRDLIDLPAWPRILWAGLCIFADDHGLVPDSMGLYKEILSGLKIRPWRIRAILGVFETRGMLTDGSEDYWRLHPCGTDWSLPASLPESVSGLPEDVLKRFAAAPLAVLMRFAGGHDAVTMRFAGGHDAVLMRFAGGHDAVTMRFAGGNGEVISHWRIVNFFKHQRILRGESKGIEEKRIEENGIAAPSRQRGEDARAGRRPESKAEKVAREAEEDRRHSAEMHRRAEEVIRTSQEAKATAEPPPEGILDVRKALLKARLER